MDGRETGHLRGTGSSRHGVTPLSLDSLQVAGCLLSGLCLSDPALGLAEPADGIDELEHLSEQDRGGGAAGAS